jgi:hypothetical protein
LTVLRAEKDIAVWILSEIYRLQHLLSSQECIIENAPAIKRFRLSCPKIVKSIMDTATNK